MSYFDIMLLQAGLGCWFGQVSVCAAAMTAMRRSMMRWMTQVGCFLDVILLSC
jgi:hypothetical protein